MFSCRKVCLKKKAWIYKIIHVQRLNNWLSNKFENDTMNFILGRQFDGEFEMKIGFGCDHSAVELKNIILEHLKAKGHECVDYGTKDPAVSVNYADFGLKVAEAVKSGEVEKGVLICGTGVGISLAANKVPGIRACVCSEPYTAKLTVQHNNANIIAFGARVVGSELAKMIVDSFFEAEFEGGRHAARIAKISEIEEKYSRKQDA